MGRLEPCSVRIAVERRTDRRTHTQTKYYFPRCACAPRVNNNRVYSGDPDSDDGEMTSVPGADVSPGFICPQTVSTTAKVIANTQLYSCYTVL